MRLPTGLFLAPLLLVQLTLPGLAADRYQLFVNFLDATSCPRANKGSATCLRAQASLMDFQEKKHFHCQVSFWNTGEVKDPANCAVTTDCRDCSLLFNNDQRVSIAESSPFGVNVAVNGNIIWNLDPQSRRTLSCV